MLLMVLIKIHELKIGKEFIFVRWRTKIDRFAHVSFSKTKLFLLKREHQVVYFVKSLPAKVINAVSRFNDYLHRRYGKHVDMIKGRSVPANKGSVSFFVSAISEYKNDIKKE